MFDLKKVAHIINQLAMLQFCFLKVYYIALQVFFSDFKVVAVYYNIAKIS